MTLYEIKPHPLQGCSGAEEAIRSSEASRNFRGRTACMAGVHGVRAAHPQMRLNDS